MVRFILAERTVPAQARERDGRVWFMVNQTARQSYNCTNGVTRLTSEDTAADGDVPSERALLVNVVPCNRQPRRRKRMRRGALGTT